MKLELRLEQKQIITPQLLLNLKLLVLPNLELETLVRTELEQNPALELIAEGGEQGKETELQNEPDSEQLPETNKDEFDITDFISDDTYALPSAPDSTFDITETTSIPQSSLEDTLLPMVKAHINENDVSIAEFIIGNLDEDGFSTIPIEEISNTCNSTPEHARKIINIIQQIEPGGIASSDVKEALLCQLEILGFDNKSLEVQLIREHYGLFLKRQYTKIEKAMGISESDLSSAFLNLKNLDPRPARRFYSNRTEYINPDFNIEWRGDNLVSTINDETFPMLRISPRYREILLQPKQFTPEEVNFARNKLHSAVNLIKAIESRKNLLRRIIDYIITNQKQFFIDGKEFIKPIPMKNAAETLGVHISTLSRACQSKYVETSVGIYPLRFFFTTRIGDHSRHSIKQKIQNLILEEDKNKPYTDDEIVTILAQQNIHLSRRTVAKYREEQNIPGSNDRIAKR